MTEEFLKELNRFLGKAALATYAGNGPEATRKETGFKELEFADGTWEYLDSYTGSLQSWGRETVWQDGKPVWTQLYGVEWKPNTEMHPNLPAKQQIS